jgi:uncharacterized protein
MATRLSALAAEKKYPWLTTVLDTYYISDSQVEEHLARIAKKGINPACHKGCHACCLKVTVPFTEPELTAISWYASEVLTDKIRARVKQRLIEHAEILECPFLVDRVCSIYPVRPLICRQFLVKSKPCETEEDVADSRPQDIIPLPKDTVIRPVAMRLLDHYKFKSVTAKRKAFEAGFIVANAKNMHEFDWTIIAKTMAFFDGDDA